MNSITSPLFRKPLNLDTKSWKDIKYRVFGPKEIERRDRLAHDVKFIEIAPGKGQKEKHPTSVNEKIACQAG